MSKGAQKGKKNHMYSHGMFGTPTYVSWSGMLSRCYSPSTRKNKRSKFYLSRTVSKEWRDFKNFYRDMGTRPPGTSIDRIDNKKGYCKENCRWSTQKEQNRNKVNSRFFKFNGKKQTISAWAEELGISRSTMRYRLNAWPIEKALGDKK